MKEIVNWIEHETASYNPDSDSDSDDDSDSDSDDSDDSSSDSDDDSDDSSSESEDDEGEEEDTSKEKEHVHIKIPGAITLNLFCKIDDIRGRMLNYFPLPRPPPPPTPAELELIAMKKAAEEKELERQRNLMLRILKRLDNKMINSGWLAWKEHLSNLRKIAKMRMRMQNMCVVVTFHAWQKLYKDNKQQRDHEEEMQQKLALEKKEAEARLQKSQQENEMRMETLRQQYARPPMAEVAIQTMNEPIATQTDEEIIKAILQAEQDEKDRIEEEKRAKLQKEKELKEREEKFQKFLDQERREEEMKKRNEAAKAAKRLALQNGNEKGPLASTGRKKKVVFSQDSLADLNDENETDSKKEDDYDLKLAKHGLEGPLNELETYSVDSLGSIESARKSNDLYKYTADDNEHSNRLKKNDSKTENRLSKPELYLRNLHHSYDVQALALHGEFDYEQKYGRAVGILETSPKKKTELIDQAISTLLGGNDHEYHSQSSRNEAKAWTDEGGVPIIKYAED
jgi:hypothetical protein